MSQNNIDTGQAANDGTGEPLRQAFTAINNNFSQIWSSGPVNSNVQISNNRIATLQTNQALILAPNGVGNVQANAKIVPSIDSVYDLGATDRRWDTVWTQYIDVAGPAVFNDLTVGGNLTVQGNIIQVGNIVTETLTIQLANAAVTDAAANGAGITVGANDDIATLLYNSGNNIWTTNIGLGVGGPITGTSVAVSSATVYGNIAAINGNFTGNVTANYFIGDGSLLTGLPAGYANADAVAYGAAGWAGNIVPAANNVYSLGNSTRQWSDLYVSNSTIYINNVPISLTAGNILTVNGNDVVTMSNTGEANLGNLTFEYATIRLEDGAAETTIDISPNIEGYAYVQVPNDATANTANVRIHNDIGNLELSAGGNYWYLDNTGNLLAPGNIVTPTNFVGTSLRTNLTDFNWSEAITGITLGATTVITLANNVFGDPWTGQVTITDVTGTTEANATWWYEAVDSNQFILYTDSTLSTLVDSSTWTAYVSGGIATTLDYGNIEINGQTVTIRSDHGDYNNKIWSFNRDGGTVFPQLTVQRGDNPSGTIQGQTLLFGDNSQEAIISTPDGVSGNEYSQRLVINPGSGYNYGEGGDIYLWAGRGGNGGGSGGDIKIRGGQGGADNGQGGYIRMEGGDGDYSGGSPGFIEITGGSGGVGQNGGYVRIQGGQGQNSGGDANITGGVGQGASGGAVNITGGVSGLGLPDYGNVYINSGASTWTFDNTGTLNLPGGTGTVESSANNISIYSDAGQLNGMLMYDTGAEIYALQDFAIFTDNANASHIWRFYANGSMTAPGAINVGDMSIGELPGYITADANTGIIVNVSGPDGGFVVDYLKEDGNANTSQGELALNSELGNTTYRISLTDDAGDGFATKIWRFDGTGNITLPSGGSVYSEGFTPSGNPGNTIVLNPHGSGAITNQKLMVYPTAGDGDHLHMTTGNLYQTELFLGSDDFYVKLANTGNVVINSNDSVGNIATWTFDNTGTLTVPGEGIIQSLNDTVVLQSKDTGTGNIVTARLGTNGGLYFETTEYPTGWLSLTNSSGDANITAASGTAGGGGKSINITAGSADQGDYYTTPGGDVNISSGIGAFNDGGGGGPGGNINIVAETSADPAGHAGNVNISAGVNDWVFDYAGNLTLPSNSFAVNYANGTPVSLGGNYGDSNVATFLSAYGSNTISTTGNVSAGNFIGSGSNVEIVAGSEQWVFDNTGNLTLPTEGYLVVTTGIIGSGASPAPSLSGFSSIATTGSSGNISASGNLIVSGYANITGNITGGNLSVTGNITGNTAGYTIGYRDIPQIVFSANATAALTDAGKHFYSTTAGNLALTLPDNSAVAFPTGATLTIVVNAAGNVLVNQGTGVTLYQAGASATGNRVVGAYGLASVMKVAANTWVISGTGVY